MDCLRASSHWSALSSQLTEPQACNISCRSLLMQTVQSMPHAQEAQNISQVAIKISAIIRQLSILGVDQSGMLHDAEQPAGCFVMAAQVLSCGKGWGAIISARGQGSICICMFLPKSSVAGACMQIWQVMLSWCQNLCSDPPPPD